MTAVEYIYSKTFDILGHINNMVSCKNQCLYETKNLQIKFHTLLKQYESLATARAAYRDFSTSTVTVEIQRKQLTTK